MGTTLVTLMVNPLGTDIVVNIGSELGLLLGTSFGVFFGVPPNTQLGATLGWLIKSTMIEIMDGLFL